MTQSQVPVGAAAREHLAAVDPVLASVIGRVGSIEVPLERDLWWALVDAIVSQQLSIKAAATILGRVAALGRNGERPTPARVLELPDEELRASGLSRAKTVYVKDLAARCLDGSLDLGRLADLDDEEVIAELTRVKGIGRWTAEMILIFALGRPDVLPLDDLGLRIAAQEVYGLEARPGAEELTRLGAAWTPHRTAASLYLWRSRRLG